MIAKQYKKWTRTGKERGKNEKERGKNGVGTGAKTGFKQYKKGISPDSRIREWRRTAALCRSTSFQLFFWLFRLFFHPFFMILAKNGKKGCPKMEERERKEHVSFPFLSHSHFLPFLAWHISTRYNVMISTTTTTTPIDQTILVVNATISTITVLLCK